jgi:aquaporin PIP
LLRHASFALMITKRVTVIRAFAYIAAQCCGAILGTLIAASLHHDAYNAAGGGVNGSDTYGVREIVTAEIMGTALLMFTVYAAIDPERAGKVIHIGALGPIAIGGAVFAAHLALIPIDGAGINPARSLGAAVVHGVWRQHWAFWVGPLVGSSVSACFYELCLKGRPAKDSSKTA